MPASLIQKGIRILIKLSGSCQVVVSQSCICQAVVSEGVLLWQLYATMMTWVGCLLAEKVLPDKWKLRECK